MSGLSTTPRATARLQFHAGFTIDHAVPLIPYFAKLGISHLYASPLLKARPGSTHGYDIVDHNEINPELGGMPALERLVVALRAHGMGLLLDIVPNHMGVGGADNAWWLDVLEWGEASKYASFFDIDWNPPEAALHKKLLAPFLGAAYGDVLASGDFKLKCKPTGALYVEYHEHHFPISPRGAAVVLHSESSLNEVSHAFADAAKLAGRQAAWAAGDAAKVMLATAMRTPEGEHALSTSLDKFDARHEDGRRRLHALLERQHYRLVWWRAAADEINWRRFFDINTLAGMRVELPRVFDATHEFILSLYARGFIDGVRIDHIDGLADPRGYARKLRRSMEVAAAQRPAQAPRGAPYILVEKILAGRERLPESWRTDGTTGYDFMDQAGGVLHDPEGEAALTWAWTSMTGRPGSFEEEEAAARRQILSDNLASELNAAAAALYRIAQRDLVTRDYTLTGIRRALSAILVHFPVYRIYAGPAGRSDIDGQVMDRALAGARRNFRAADRELLDVVRNWLAEEPPRDEKAGPRRTERMRAQVRFQQLSAPTAAKSVEDTAFYRFGRLLSRNEVGSNPGTFAISPAAFHASATERAKSYPGSLLATATHDHKRGEDTRARLAVLSEIPVEWETAIGRWTRLNAIVHPADGPSQADEMMLYQMLVAAWPFGLRLDDAQGLKTLRDRILAWQVKAMREAKLASEWAAPDETYETAAAAFLDGVLDPSRAVIGEILDFADRIAPAGVVNSLAQTMLRLTSPGVPDLYQGTEFWDFSLVDPDNRRPVDFATRREALEESASPAVLLAHWKDGRVKQAVIARSLKFRAEYAELFAKGAYTKLEAQGPAARHVLAFARVHKGKTSITAVTRLAAAITQPFPLPDKAFWADTTLTLPAPSWHDVLNETKIAGPQVAAADLFANLPVALLAST